MNDIPHPSSGGRSPQNVSQQRPPTRTIPDTPIPSSSPSMSLDSDDSMFSHLEQQLQPCPDDIGDPHLPVTTTATTTAELWPQWSQSQADPLLGNSITENTYLTTETAIVAAQQPATLPNETMQNALSLRVESLDAELAFLHDQWISICITLSSLRHTYIAILADRDDGTHSATFSNYGDFPIPDNIAVSTFRVRPNDSAPGFTAVHPPSRRWSAIAPNSLEPDIDHEMLLALDEILVQIRQMETNMERLERHIKNTIQPLRHNNTDE